MREFLSLLIMPLTIFYGLLIVAGILFLLKRKRATWSLFFIAGIWFLIISTRFIPNLLISHLENQFRPLIKVDSLLNTKPVYIMILGGGHSDDKNLPPNDQLSGIALGRLVEAVRIYKKVEGVAQGTELSAQGKKAQGSGFSGNQGRRDEVYEETGVTLVLSGYSGRLSLSQAEVLSRTALSLGVNKSDIKILTTTRNTADEAKTFFSEFGNRNTLILVTDAVHMPRAMKLFMKAGLNPLPAPTNHIIKHGSVRGRFDWMPAAGNIGRMEVAVHEYAGMVWSWLGGE